MEYHMLGIIGLCCLIFSIFSSIMIEHLSYSTKISTRRLNDMTLVSIGCFFFGVLLVAVELLAAYSEKT